MRKLSLILGQTKERKVKIILAIKRKYNKDPIQKSMFFPMWLYVKDKSRTLTMKLKYFEGQGEGR